jgi:uncharacterized membrane protein
VTASVWADVLRSVLVLVHVGVTAAWLGSMIYSLAVVQPKIAEFFADAGEREDFATVLASGARWKVLALAALLALSGAGLTATELTDGESPGDAWTALVATKAALLTIAVALFGHVSWRLWPARLHAHMTGSDELGRIQARFRIIALALTALIACGLIVGVVADSVR